MLRKLIEETKNKLNVYALNIATQLNYIHETSMNNKLDKNNKFEFNDLDNHVWFENEKTISFDSQNSIIIGVKLEKYGEYGWQICLIDKNQTGSNKKYTQLINEINKIKELRDIAYKVGESALMTLEPINIGNYISSLRSSLSSLDDKEIYKLLDNFKSNKNKDFLITEFCADLHKIDHFMFQLNNTVNNLQEEYGTSPDYPEDINSHDYQLKYSCFNYTKEKIEFYHHVFMVLGGGYRWDTNGNLCQQDISYQKDIAQLELKSIPAGKLGNIYPAFDSQYNNLLHYPDNITPQWQEARLNFIDALKERVKEFPNLTKKEQLEFLGARSDEKRSTPYFTIEKLEDFIKKCESTVPSKKNKI